MGERHGPALSVAKHRMRRRVPSSSEQEIEIAYVGDALQSGEMDVRELAPALLSIGEAFARSNKVLNGDRSSASVRVRSEFKAGSFHIDLVLVVTWLQAAKTLLHIDEIKTAKDLAEALGFVKSKAIGLINLLKRTRGKKPDAVQPLPSGNVNVSIGNINFEISGPTYNLYRDDAVRAAMREVVQPLRAPGVSDMKILDEGNVVEEVSRDDVASFDPTLAVGEEVEESVLSDTTREAVIRVERPAFVERMAWTVSDGESSFRAVLKDETFAERINTRQEFFGAGDLLRVRLRSRTSRTSGGLLRTDNEIAEVLGRIPEQRQYPLLPEVRGPG